MPDKLKSYAEMAQGAASILTGSYERWTDFLSTASRLYKYPFAEQVMIYVQRPDATACAGYDLWTAKMDRYVRRGSRGIALIDASGDAPRLRYVFDVSDTGGGRQPYIWQFEPEHEAAVRDMLVQNYNVPSSGVVLEEQFARVAMDLARGYWDDHEREILDIVDGSFLEGYDDFNIGVAFRNAVAASVTYSLMERCGLDTEGYFSHEDFLSIFDFNTLKTITALGTAVSRIDNRVLRQIEATVKRYERERSDEHERDDLHQNGRLTKKGHINEVYIRKNYGDSKASGEFAPFLNIMNEWYLRDCSRKQIAAYQARGRAGKPTTNHAIYGYRKDPEDKYHWLIDEEAAAVVKRIFQLTISGHGPQVIADILRDEKIERPAVYLGKRAQGKPYTST